MERGGYGVEAEPSRDGALGGDVTDWEMASPAKIPFAAREIGSVNVECESGMVDDGAAEIDDGRHGKREGKDCDGAQNGLRKGLKHGCASTVEMQEVETQKGLIIGRDFLVKKDVV